MLYRGKGSLIYKFANHGCVKNSINWLDLSICLCLLNTSVY
jgi:hypothetical protein